MLILGRSNAKKTIRPDYRKVRAAYLKSFYPITRYGMGSPTPARRRINLNGNNGGYGHI